MHQVSDRLFAIAYRILRDHEAAEDALQDALIAAWQQLPRLRERDRFEAWIHRILVHACYGLSRRNRRWEGSIRILTTESSSASDDVDAIVDRDELERIFRRLPLEQRAVFVLHHYVGLPLVEVAETLGVPAGTARSRLHYATRTLRAAMVAEAQPGPEEVRSA